MKRTYFYLLFITFICVIGATSSCKKPVFFSSENLLFSTDTLVFDTVFTTIGSTTQQFKLYNNDNRTVTIDEVELMGGSDSPFRINFNGTPGINFTNIALEGNDSLFVFVEVTLDVNNSVNPMVIEDSIRFRTNGTDQYVQLRVWGQDMYYHNRDTNSGIWPNDKPHLIYGYAAVDSAESLTIQAGTDIYLHKNAAFINYKGTLNVNGTATEKVTFQGDRLESFYDDVSAQYYAGLYFIEAKESTVDHVIIKNATAGLQVNGEDPTNTGYTVTLTNSEIYNCGSYGIFLFADETMQAGSLKVENTISAKNGQYSFLVLGGGDYNINNSSLLSYGPDASAAVVVKNYYYNPNSTITSLRNINEGVISNSIIYGNSDQEIGFDTTTDNGAVSLNIDFADNLIRSEEVLTGPFYSASNTFEDSQADEPLFYNKDTYDFRVWWSANSSIINMANPSTATPNDISGNARLGSPDRGAHEAQ